MNISEAISKMNTVSRYLVDKQHRNDSVKAWNVILSELIRQQARIEGLEKAACIALAEDKANDEYTD